MISLQFKVSFKAPEFDYDFRIRDDLMRSQTAEDFRYKGPETIPFCKHSSVRESHYIYPPSKNVSIMYNILI